MQSMTYGLLPTKEEFETAFYKKTDGLYKITLSQSDSRAVDGFMLGDGELKCDYLWECIKEIVQASEDGVIDIDSGAMDLVSGILGTLGFEWI